MAGEKNKNNTIKNKICLSKKNIFFFLLFFVLLIIIVPNISFAFNTTNFQLELKPADCGDGIDNDNDSLIDFPADSGCTSLFDDDERNIAPPVVDGPGFRSGGGSTSLIYVPPKDTTLLVTGYSYPNKVVNVLKDGNLVVDTLTDADGAFRYEFTDISPGNYGMGFYGIDKQNYYSRQLSIPVTVYSGMANEVNNILIPPTVSVQNYDIRRGEKLNIHGQSIPNSIVILKILYEEFLNNCQFNCDDLNFDIYLVNPDGQEISMNSAFTKITRQSENVTIINFEDKGVDFDYNDVVILVEKEDCSKYKITVQDYNAANIHKLKMKLSYQGNTSDILLWNNTKLAVKENRLIDASDFISLCDKQDNLELENNKKTFLEYQVPSDNEGNYNFFLETKDYKYGDYVVIGQTLFKNEFLTIESYPQDFKIGVDTSLNINVLKGDLNNDGLVNLTDFSILVYWYNNGLKENDIQKEIIYLNGDQIIDLADFSLMAFYWTG